MNPTNLKKNISKILENVSLSDKVWFNTGGKARFFSQPVSEEELRDAINFAKENKLDLFFLGQGANVLISDEGFDGLVVNIQNKSIEIVKANSDNTIFVKAGAGVIFQELINWCLENNIIGLEEFSGIPGTVGGSVYINIHYFQFLLSNFLVEAEVINKQNGQLSNVNKDWFNFGYNQSTLQNGDHFLVNATFALRKCTQLEAEFNKGRSKEIIRHRNSRYPNKNTCGSFFRNFHESEVTLLSQGKKLIYIAYYLDKVGVKGSLTYGGAVVSYQHANMIVSQTANCTSSDIVNLAKIMQEKVFDNFGLIPEPECQLIGFKNYPLLTKETLEKNKIT